MAHSNKGISHGWKMNAVTAGLNCEQIQLRAKTKSPRK